MVTSLVSGLLASKDPPLNSSLLPLFRLLTTILSIIDLIVFISRLVSYFDFSSYLPLRLFLARLFRIASRVLIDFTSLALNSPNLRDTLLDLPVRGDRERDSFFKEKDSGGIRKHEDLVMVLPSLSSAIFLMSSLLLRGTLLFSLKCLLETQEGAIQVYSCLLNKCNDIKECGL